MSYFRKTRNTRLGAYYARAAKNRVRLGDAYDDLIALNAQNGAASATEQGDVFLPGVAPTVIPPAQGQSYTTVNISSPSSAGQLTSLANQEIAKGTGITYGLAGAGALLMVTLASVTKPRGRR